MKNTLRTLAVLAPILATAAGSSFAADPTVLHSLQEQVRLLERQLDAVKHQLEMATAKTPEAIPRAPAPKLTVNDQSYVLASGDGANSIRFRGLAQADLRQFLDDGGGIANNAFVMRRIRIITEGTFARNFSYQFVPEFGGSSVSIHEANLAVALTPSLGLRFGRFKEGIGLERLQSDSWTFLNERSILTNLVPDRDVGVQAFGKAAAGRVDYAVGIFNGLPDSASSNNTDYDEDKDIAGRVFVTPFKGMRESPLRDLSLGVGASVGRQKSVSGRASGYRTDGQQVFFSYVPGAIADGAVWRVVPQLDYRRGRFGLLGEYAVSTVNLRPAARAPKIELQHKAWNLGAGWVVTGENSTFNGVSPREDFDWSAGTWGALELTARAATLDIDDAAFPRLASPAASASAARSLGVGANWYLSKAVVFKFAFYQTRFDHDPATPAIPAPVIRQDEKVLISRFQLSF